ncbi:MAG: HEAT repeat domain-containing protein [Candidatus Brocadiia bacterium]
MAKPKRRPAISDRVIKLLALRSGGRCAFPGCGKILTVEGQISESEVIGEIAHIAGESLGSKRYDPSMSEDQRNGYENLIFLCPTHHTQIDKQEKDFPVERLLEMKAKHEKRIRDGGAAAIHDYCLALSATMESTWRRLPIATEVVYAPYPVGADICLWRGPKEEKDSETTRPTTLEAIQHALTLKAPVLIVGGPGAGKTVALRTAAAEYARALASKPYDGASPIPIYVDLSDWKAVCPNCNTLAQVLAEQRPTEIPDDVPILWFLDGLDLLPESGTRTPSFFIGGAMDLHGKGHSFVFTSRPNDAILEQFRSKGDHARLKLRDLDQEARIAWVAVNFSTAIGLPEKIEKTSPAQANLLNVPLFFSMTVSMALEQKEVPKSEIGGRAGVFDRFITYAVNRACVLRRISATDRDGYLCRGQVAVSGLFWGALCSGDEVYEDSIPKDKLETLFLAAYPDASEAKMAGLHAGLAVLKEAGILYDGDDGRAICVIHQQFAEHFAARVVADRLAKTTNEVEYEDELWRYFTYKRLDDVFAQALSILESVRIGSIRMTYKVLASEALYWEVPMALLAGTDDHRAVGALAECLKDANWFVRSTAAFALGHLGGKQAVDALIECLEDKDSNVLCSAVHALAEIGDPCAVPALIECLDDEGGDRDVCDSAVYALSKLGDPCAVPALIECLERQGYESNVSVSAALALGTLGIHGAVKPLIACLRDKDSPARANAAYALGELGDQAAVEPLIECLKDCEQFVRSNATEALGKFGSQCPIGPLMECLRDSDSNARSNALRVLVELSGRSSPGFLIEYMKDKDREVRDYAARALRKLGDSRTVGALIGCLDDSRWYVRSGAAEVLGHLGDARAVEPLLRCLNDDDHFVHSSAARALWQLGDPSAVGPLIKCLKDNKSRVRSCAAEALGKLDDRTAAPPLVECLRDSEWFVRSNAAKALGGLGERTAACFLMKCLKDRDIEVRRSAAEALGNLGDQSSADLLIECLQDSDSDLRSNACKALGKLGHRRAVDPLMECLKDGDMEVRRCAAEALGGLGDYRSVGSLVECLQDGEVLVRSCAVAALCRLDEHSAVDPVIKYLMHKDSPARAAAAEALAQLGNRSAVAPLVECLKDPEWFVHSAAAAAIAVIAARVRISFEELMDHLANHGINHEDCGRLLGLLGRRVRRSEYEAFLKAAGKGKGAAKPKKKGRTGKRGQEIK